MNNWKRFFFRLLVFAAVYYTSFLRPAYAQISCRVYNSQQSSSTPGTTSVNNAANAVSSDTTDYSTLVVPLNALGTTTAYQNLIFPVTVPGNTPVVVKVGGISAALNLSSQIVIQAYNNNVPIGPAITGSSINSSGNTRLRLLPQAAYNNIRISLSSTVSVASSINIFYAYQNISLTSSFSVNQLVQCLDGNSFMFTNTSAVDVGPLTYSWNFGDGVTSVLVSPSHTYAAAGTYPVTLTTTSLGGCVSLATQTVTVVGGLFSGNLAGLPYYWIGAPGADWGTVTNWRVASSGNYYIPPLIPAANNNIFIGLPNTTGCTQAVQQLITIGAGTIAQCADLNLGQNAILQLNGSLTLTGNLNDASSGSNGIRGSQSGKITFTGNGNPTSLRLATGYQQLASLDITRTNGVSAAVTLASPLDIFNYVNLGSSNILDSQSGNLTLKSTQNITASVYALPVGAVIKGTVNAERFFYAGGNPAGIAAYRSYRLISSPVSNVNYNYSSAQFAPVYNLNYLKAGAIVTGPANGNFDKTGNPTMYVFREDVNISNTSFTSGNFKGVTSIDPASNNTGTQSRNNLNSVTDTTIQLAAGNGVLFFFRGDRSNFIGKTTPPFTAPQDVTFINSGVLNQGSIPVKVWFKPGTYLSYTNSPAVANTGVMGYNLVGNPYACSIDWNSNSATNTVSPGIIFSAPGDVDTKMYVFDPLARTFNWYDSSIGATGGSDGNPNVSRYIASGQGFFVRAKTGSAALTFTEAAKVNGQLAQSLPSLLGLPLPSANNLSTIKIQLKLDSLSYDYAAIYFNEKWKSVYDPNEDAPDLDGNGNTVNLSTYSADEKRLAINKMPALTNRTIKVPLYVNGNSGSYTLLFPEISNIPAQYTVFLKDNFTGDSVQLTNSFSYRFQVNQSNQNTWGEKRFALIFHLPNARGNYSLLSFAGQLNQKASVLNWTTRNEGNYTSFTLEKSTDGGKTYTSTGSIQADFSGKYTLTDLHPVNGENVYRLKQDDLYDRVTYSDLVKLFWVPPASSEKTFLLYPNPVKDQLYISLLKQQNGPTGSRIVNMTGNVVSKQKSFSSMWIQSVQMLAPGTYAIQLYDTVTGKIIGQTKFIKN